MIKNIIFDMGGVIFRQNTEEAFRRFQALGINTDYYMGAYGQKDFFLDVETGDIDAATFCRKMAEATGRELVSYEEAQHAWLGFMRDVPVERLHNLLELRKHYRLCLLSNTNPFIMDYMRSPRFSADGLPITHYFDALYCSYEMHAYKPNADIFKQALAAGGMKAEECIFVDDSVKNTDAARALGFCVLHVKPDEDWMEQLAQMLYWNTVAQEALARFQEWVGKPQMSAHEWKCFKDHHAPFELPKEFAVSPFPLVMQHEVQIPIASLDVTPLTHLLEMRFGTRPHDREEALECAYRLIMDAATWVWGG